MKKLLLIVLLATPPLHADTLSDVKGALKRLTGQAPLRASVEVQLTTNTKDEEESGKPKTDKSRAAVDVATGPEGLQMSYSVPLLAKAEEEALAAARDAEKNSPTRQAIGEVAALDVAELLDFAPVLLRNMEDAKLIEDKPSQLNGRPARFLALKLTPKLSKSEKKRVKSFDLTLKLWVGANDFVPLAAERTLKLKASFLLLKFEQNQSERWSFTTRDDHLVALRHDEQSSGSGVGQSFSRSRSTTVTLK